METTDDYRLYAVIANEALKKTNGIRGKMHTQTGHAFLHAFWDAENRFPEDAKKYKYSGLAKKITLIVESVDELHVLAKAYHDRCGVSLVEDRGLTVFKEPTITCLGIGPIAFKNVDTDLKSLKTFT